MDESWLSIITLEATRADFLVSLYIPLSIFALFDNRRTSSLNQTDWTQKTNINSPKNLIQLQLSSILPITKIQNFPKTTSNNNKMQSVIFLKKYRYLPFKIYTIISNSTQAKTEMILQVNPSPKTTLKNNKMHHNLHLQLAIHLKYTKNNLKIDREAFIKI